MGDMGSQQQIELLLLLLLFSNLKSMYLLLILFLIFLYLKCSSFNLLYISLYFSNDFYTPKQILCMWKPFGNKHDKDSDSDFFILTNDLMSNYFCFWDDSYQVYYTV